MASDDTNTPQASQAVQDELAKARADVARAQTRKYQAEAQALEAEAKMVEYKLTAAEENERERLAKDKFRRIYTFDTGVAEAQVKSCMDTLTVWSEIDPGCDITLRIVSPGGGVIEGMWLFDFLTSLRNKGHKVITEAYGWAASMGGILLQAGNVRRIAPEAYVLLHEISFGVRGKIGEVEDEMEFVKKVSERVLDIFARRSAEAAANGTASHPLSKTQFRRRWNRKDWWLDSGEALKHGIVDEVIGS